MSFPPRWYSSTAASNRLLALARGGDARHHRQVGADDAGAAVRGARALGVARTGPASRRWPSRTPCGSGPAAGVGRRVVRREPWIGVWSTADHAGPPGPSRGSASSFPSRPRRSRRRARRAGCRRRPRRLWVVAPRTGSVPDGVRTEVFSDAVVQVAPGERAAGPQFLHRALEHHLAAVRAGARAEVDDAVGDRDRSGLCRRRALCCPCPAAAAAARSSGDVVGCSPMVGSSKT
jgi:hypothetical protein